MSRRKAVKSLPDFGQTNCGSEEMCRVSRRNPSEKSRIGNRLSRLTDGVGVQDEIHSRTDWTRSSGIFGGSQSVVPRIESYQFRSFRTERSGVALRWGLRCGCLRAVPFDLFLFNQSKSSRACRADSFLTSRTAKSIVLIEINYSNAPSRQADFH